MTPKTIAVVVGFAWAVILSVLPPGAVVACLVVLIVFGGVAKGFARRSDNSRYWVAAIYFGTILGLFLAFYLSNHRYRW